jgi:hypothetical protein
MGLILGYGILTHGVIVLNDGLYWDGWILDVWQQNRDKISMRRLYSEVGMPNLYYEHQILGRFPRRILVYRAISLISILSIAVFVFLTAVHTNAFNTLQATVISLLLLSYPAYAVTFDGVVSLQYTFKIAIYYVGCFLAVTTIGGSDATSMTVFVISLILFFVALNANSLLVYFGGFLLYYAWLVHAQSPNGVEAYEIVKLFLLTILPIAYWVMKETRTPRHGYYKDYNKFRISRFSTLLHNGFNALRYGIDIPMIKPIGEVIRSKNTSFVFASLLFASLAFHFGEDLVAVSVLHALEILLIGYALLFLGALPFVLVGQFFSEGGWSSKNFMLFHLPFALIVFGWLQLVPDSFRTVLIPVILVANTIYIVKTHLLYIAVSVKDKALIRWLAANAHISSASVIKIRDVHWIEYPFEHKEEIFRPAYLSCMVKHIWPGSRILAVLDDWGFSGGRALTPEEIEQVLEATTIRYSFAPQVQRGSQYQITIATPAERFDAPKSRMAFDEAGDVNPVKQTVMIRMALEYLYLKWFSSKRLASMFEKHFSFSALEL